MEPFVEKPVADVICEECKLRISHEFGSSAVVHSQFLAIFRDKLLNHTTDVVVITSQLRAELRNSDLQ
jgi:hypothetical protein